MQLDKPARKFRPLWALQYAVAVAEREPETGVPTKAVCLMCRAFERDETEGAKRRKRKTKVQCFSPPWRPDNMRRHLEQQHALRWGQYKDLSDEDKRRFFPTNVAISTRPRVDTVETSVEIGDQQVSERNTAVVETMKRSRTSLVDKDIVDELLRGIEGDDVEFNGFEMQEIEWIEVDDENLDENEARYAVIVDSGLEMNICVKYVAGGVSFKQAAGLYQGVMEGISATENGQCTERRVMNLCRVACAVNLQRLRGILKGKEVWAFAVVLELCNCAGSSFIDVRVQFEHGGEIHSVHLIGIVVLDEMMTDESVDLVVRYLNVIAPQWRTKLIGVSLLNDRCGCMERIMNRLAAECEESIYCDYSLSSKLSQLMREACRLILTAEFTNTMIALVSHLRSLRALNCPKLVEGSWESTVKVLQWLVTNQAYVIECSQQSQYVGFPPPEWWILALVLTNVTGRVNSILQQLSSGKGLPHDRQHLIDLMNHLSMMTGAAGPFIPSEFLSMSCEDIVIGSFSLNPVTTTTFLKSQGNFASSAVDSLQPDTYEALVNVTSIFVLTVLSKLSQIIAENNNDSTEWNRTIYQVPTFLPNTLCKMRHQDFVGIMQQQRIRLEKRFSNEEIEKIEVQHRALRNAYLLEKRVSDEIDRLSDSCSFSEGWREGIIAGVDCRVLRYFCGALAAAATSSTPRSEDSEFMLINWCKIPFSQSITDFSLEAILHAQNYRSWPKY
ncbi:hypothetical protein L915_05891 [Phytophthora nicotianae]|uniref:Uncharacterized protein n=1 Tax=Phytophthora nicotianae TaxID=4792 RepID=W2H545_PHYNI|nr:hypothetical protein L915_05891 [Phytophthora nicotianae]